MVRMNLGPMHVSFDLPNWSRLGRGLLRKPLAGISRPRSRRQGVGTAGAAAVTAIPKRRWFNFAGAARNGKGELAKTGAVGADLDPQTDLYQDLSLDLQQECTARPYLWDYLRSIPVADIGVPHYYANLTKDLRSLKYKNLIYPVSADAYIHIYPDVADTRDSYIPIEPSNIPSVPDLMKRVDQQMMANVLRLRAAKDAGARAELMIKFLDEVCTVGRKPGRFQRKTINVTEKELYGLKYLQVRDKQGLGALEPLIQDLHIEDISCDGVGPIFLEHKIFGGLKAGIHFDSLEELDQFVIKLSERIGRPVTVREPIVDSVLPDGSRVNIVYGREVSKKGSNFTIRKFSETPLSFLDLIGLGTMNYEMAAYLSLTLGAGMNVFVAGETASGKTTLLNAITTFIDPLHKIVSIEDTPELQVPHPHWAREMTRGSGRDDASVTMFDLLRAALRQRPNEIIIGEIRGEEGAIAFQAMQTGHTCMSTFHASSIEKLIQRLTGSPINIPKTYIDNLQLAIIISSVRLSDGSTARRVVSINEILGYNSEVDSFEFVEVFRWNPSTDRFEFPARSNSRLLEEVVAVRRGLSGQDARRIYDEIDDRATIFKRLHERGVTNFYELYKILSQAHREGLLR